VALTCALRLRTAPSSVMGSDADMCSMTLHGSWVVEEGLTAMACSDAHVFPRHAYVLPRRLVDVWTAGVIMTCKPCEQASQHDATVHRHTDNRSQAWRCSATPYS
jgi:hypothetical protein